MNVGNYLKQFCFIRLRLFLFLCFLSCYYLIIIIIITITIKFITLIVLFFKLLLIILVSTLLISLSSSVGAHIIIIIIIIIILEFNFITISILILLLDRLILDFQPFIRTLEIFLFISRPKNWFLISLNSYSFFNFWHSQKSNCVFYHLNKHFTFKHLRKILGSIHWANTNYIYSSLILGFYLVL